MLEPISALQRPGLALIEFAQDPRTIFPQTAFGCRGSDGFVQAGGCAVPLPARGGSSPKSKKTNCF